MMRIKSLFHGIFELCLFLSDGAKRIPQERGPALKSFAIPVLLMAANLIIYHYKPTPKLGEVSLGYLFVVYTPILILTLGTMIAMLWGLLYFTKRLEGFWPAVMAINFLEIPIALLSYIPIALVLTGVHAWENVFPLLVVIQFYGVAICAFAVAYIANIPWPLAGSLGLLHYLLTIEIVDFILALAGLI